MTEHLSPEFWNNRYKEADTGWDIGEVSTPLKHYIDGIPNKNLRILIPGCGNAWEAMYLIKSGFTQVTCIDVAPMACDALRERSAGTGLEVICEDFFTHKGQYDLILEQTFFCAIDPALRNAYARQMAALLVPGGKLAGLLFCIEFEKEGPPFGGNVGDYELLFQTDFKFKHFSLCSNSISRRQGNEWFMVLVRK